MRRVDQTSRVVLVRQRVPRPSVDSISRAVANIASGHCFTDRRHYPRRTSHPDRMSDNPLGRWVSAIPHLSRTQGCCQDRSAIVAWIVSVTAVQHRAELVLPRRFPSRHPRCERFCHQMPVIIVFPPESKRSRRRHPLRGVAVSKANTLRRLGACPRRRHYRPIQPQVSDRSRLNAILQTPAGVVDRRPRRDARFRFPKSGS